MVRVTSRSSHTQASHRLAGMAQRDHSHGLRTLDSRVLPKDPAWARVCVCVEGTLQSVHRRSTLRVQRLLAFVWIPTHVSP